MIMNSLITYSIIIYHYHTRSRNINTTENDLTLSVWLWSPINPRRIGTRRELGLTKAFEYLQFFNHASSSTVPHIVS